MQHLTTISYQSFVTYVKN